MFQLQNEKSVLFITLDSCRYDTFVNAAIPNLKRIGTLYRAMAPGNFTYGSHAAMFVGFTPGIAELKQSYVNPKYGKIFKLVGAGYPAKGTECFTLVGGSIVEGFRQQGYLTIGSGAVGWFDPDTLTGRHLTKDFEKFYYSGSYHSLQKQLAWINNFLSDPERPVFVFMNIGETHVPYYHEGAPWSEDINPCVPFSEINDREECLRRQIACLEYVDRWIGPLIDAFSASTIVVCSDHGDCWGEDGLWEHGIHHEKVIEVPLIFRLNTNAQST